MVGGDTRRNIMYTFFAAVHALALYNLKMYIFIMCTHLLETRSVTNGGNASGYNQLPYLKVASARSSGKYLGIYSDLCRSMCSAPDHSSCFG